MEVEEKLNLFFAMMLAGVYTLSSLIEGTPFIHGRHFFPLMEDRFL